MKHQHIKGILLTMLAGWYIQAAKAQTPGFVQDDIIKVAGVTNDNQIAGLSLNQKQTIRTFTDGLGGPIQTIALQASPLQKDLIQPVVYDNMGRQTTSYLPYTGNDGSGVYRTDALTTQAGYYNNGNSDKVADDASPYSKQVFDNSPLQRLLQAGSIGAGFQPQSGQHYKTVKYSTNTSSDNVIQWGTNGSYQNTYGTGSLSITDATDEDGSEVWIFKDRNGQTVLKRQLANQTVNGVNETYFDTYYVYNSAGAITYVVPPKAIAYMNNTSHNYSLAQNGINKLIFSYAYDTMGHLIKKVLPGGMVLYIVYDPLNRPVLIQDGNLRAASQWNYIKYDAKGRAVSQGIYTDATHTSPSSMQAYVSGLSGYNTTWIESRSATVINNGYYTNDVFPNTGITPLAYVYFDDYDLNLDGTADYSYTSPGGLTGEATPTALTRGMQTMISKRTVGTGLSDIWLTSVVFYDKHGNAIQVKSNNQLNYINQSTLTDNKTSVPDFTGKVLQNKIVKVTGSGAGNTNTIVTSLNYDNSGNRLASVDQTYNSQAAIRIASYEYNELGQLVKKNLGVNGSGGAPANVTLGTGNSVAAGNTLNITASQSIDITPGFFAANGSVFSAKIQTGSLQSVDYRYNIRGQLLSINNSNLSDDSGTTNTNADVNDLFGMQLLYDQADVTVGNVARYSGHISAVKWMSRDGNNVKTNERSYKYTYDGLNRLTVAAYAERAAGNTGNFSINSGGFDEAGISYDENGNLLTLQRNSSSINASSHAVVDDLHYTYDSANPNQLQNVADGAGSNYTGFGFRNLTGSTGNYGYNTASGNLTADPYKGLTIDYNVLNRTNKITITTAPGRYINYTYDASGAVVRKQQYDNNALQTTTDYVDGFVFVNNALSYFSMPEGRVMNVSGTMTPEYVLSDQQGNARFSFRDNGSGGVSIVQENSFYAYGLNMANSPVNMPTVPNKNLYNGGAEWQNDYGNLPDYYQTFYRNYDAALGRFISIDPQAESAESMTGYQYAGNNPIMFNDPMGDTFHSSIPSVEAQLQRDQVWFNGYGGGSLGDMEFARGLGGGIINAGDDNFQLQNAARNGDPVALNILAAKYGTTPDANMLQSLNDFFGANGSFNSRNGNYEFNSYTVAGNNVFNYNTTSAQDLNNVILQNHSVSVNANQAGGVDLRGVGEATLGLLGGTAEVITAIGGEWFSGGLSTPVSLALGADGSVRAAASYTKLLLALSGDKSGRNLPGNIGGIIGSAIDLSTGSTNGKKIGGLVNDAFTVFLTGGTTGTMTTIFDESVTGGVKFITIGAQIGAYSDVLSNGGVYDRK